MSSGEWQVMARWWNDGIPLPVVLRGLATPRNKGSTLGYYNPAVDEAEAQRLKALQR